MAFNNYTISAKELIQNFFRVPQYQRDYIWEEEKFGELMDSLIDFSQKYRNGDRYFLGAAVFQKIKEENLPGDTYFVVDGQQRLTSLFIIITAAIEHLKKYGLDMDNIGVLRSDYLQKKDPLTNQTQVRMLHSDSSSKEAIIAIMENKTEIPQGASRSSERIYSAYRLAIQKFEKISKDLLEDNIKIRESVSNLLRSFENVKLLPFVSETLEESLEVFETLNSKGVELSSLDILKSQLFQNAGEEDSDEWVSLTTAWKQFTHIYEPLNINANKFLRYICVTQFGESVSSVEARSWLVTNENKTHIQSDPSSFVETLLHTATVITRIRSGLGPDGSPNPNLMNIVELAKSAEQHYFMIIPIWTVSAKLFSEAASVAESFIFVNKVLTRYTGATEKRFIEWGRDLNKLSGNETEYIAYLNSNVWITIREQKDLLQATLRLTNQKNSTKAMIIWLLRRAEHYARQVAKIPTPKGVAEVIGFDLEHIEPQSSTEIDANLIGSLGNLTLWERGANKAAGADSYPEKKPRYGTSAFKMTNALNLIPPGSSKDAEAFKLFYQADTWSIQSINERTEKLTSTILKAMQIE